MVALIANYLQEDFINLSLIGRTACTVCNKDEQGKSIRNSASITINITFVRSVLSN